MYWEFIGHISRSPIVNGIYWHISIAPIVPVAIYLIPVAIYLIPVAIYMPVYIYYLICEVLTCRRHFFFRQKNRF